MQVPGKVMDKLFRVAPASEGRGFGGFVYGSCRITLQVVYVFFGSIQRWPTPRPDRLDVVRLLPLQTAEWLLL